MSRCFPYPPPGYVKNGIRDEALIESIKLQREGERAKKERKEDKKREKKEKDKKEKEKSRGNVKAESKQNRHKKRHREERSQENEKGRNLQNTTKDEKEQLENSGLTEEHGHPVGSQNSFDSTLNSQKRQKLSSSPDGGHNSSSIIRIRLPLQRQKDPDVLPNKERPCTASGRTDDASIQVMHEPLGPGREREEHPCSTSTKGCPEVTLIHDEQRCLSTGASESCAQKEETSQASSLCGICPPDLALKFRDVIGNWVPPTMQSEATDFDDDDWLFELKQNQKCGSRRCEEDIVGSSHANTTTWPQVCFLPEVDIYALPFTMPY